MPRPAKPAEKATPFSAIAMMLCAGLLFTCLDTTAKYLVLSGLDPQFVAWVRFATHVVLVLVLFRAWSNPRVLALHSPTVQILRGALLFGSTFLNFVALGYLQLAESMSIYFFGPMMITAFAGPMLGERVGWRRWVAVGVGFLGVLLITRPGMGVLGVGHLFAFGSVTCYVFYALLTRRVGDSETSESLIFYAGLTPVVMMLPVLPSSASWPASPLIWVLLASLGVYGSVGHFLLIRAFQSATASALAPYPYLQMVWAMAAGYLVFSQLPDGWTLAGCGVIVASGLYIVHREHRLRLDASAALAEPVATSARSGRE